MQDAKSVTDLNLYVEELRCMHFDDIMEHETSLESAINIGTGNQYGPVMRNGVHLC